MDIYDVSCLLHWHSTDTAAMAPTNSDCGGIVDPPGYDTENKGAPCHNPQPERRTKP